MNNDPTPGIAAWQRPQPGGDQHSSSGNPEDQELDGDDRRDVRDLQDPSEREPRPPQPPPSSEPSRRQKRKDGLNKKLQFVNHLQKSLDMVVIAYICTLYYMECSFLRLLLRFLPHFIFISPKDTNLLLPAHRPHVFAIFVPNLLCMILHIVLPPPQGSEATRGYLHGGVIIDFIGQKPPTSRFSFWCLDLVILAVQCLMLAVHLEREKLRKVALPSLQSVSVPVLAAAAAVAGDGQVLGTLPETTQDHDAEERGVMRDEAYAADGDENGDRTETQPLMTEEREGRHYDRGGSGGQGGSSSSSRFEAGGGYAPAGVDMLDIMRSGNAMLSNFHVVHAVRTVGNDYQSAAAYSLQGLGYTATLAAAMAAERRARLGVQQGQQVQQQ